MLKTSNVMLMLVMAGTVVAPIFAASDAGTQGQQQQQSQPNNAPQAPDATAKPNADTKPATDATTEEPGFFRKGWNKAKDGYSSVVNTIDDAGKELPYVGESYGKSEGWKKTGYRTGFVAGCGLAAGAVYKLVSGAIGLVVGDDSDDSKEVEVEEPVQQQPQVVVNEHNAYKYCTPEQRQEVDALLKAEKEAQAAKEAQQAKNAKPKSTGVIARKRRIAAPAKPAKPALTPAQQAAADAKRKNVLAYELIQKAVAIASAA